MASTYSQNLRLELIGTGEQQGTWGATTNTNLGTLLEQAITGYTSVAVTDGADTTLTTANGASDQARNMVINLTGALTAARNVICPATPKVYIVKNATTGGYAVTFKVTGQTGVSIPNGATMLVFVDGTDVRQANIPVNSSGAGVISVTDNTNAALRVTQLGTGAAIRVEDEANPDSTPFIVDATGNVSTGTTSAIGRATIKAPVGGNALTLVGRDSDGYARLEAFDRTGSNRTGSIQFAEDGAITFARTIGGTLTERAAFDTNGNFVVGATSGVNKLAVNGSGQFYGGISGNEAGTHVFYQSNLSYIGAWGPNTSTNGSLAFYSARSNGVNGLETLRIDGSGNLLKGVTSAISTAYGTGEISFKCSSAGMVFQNTGSAGGSAPTVQVFLNSSGTAVGYIACSGTSTSFTNLSDYRLKENVEPLANASQRVAALKPVRFNFISEPDKIIDGFLAHEVQDVVPEAVIGKKDAVGKNGDPIHQGLDQSKLIPLLTAALQEAINKIDALEARILALEAA